MLFRSKSFCWEKLALKKTRIINENNFNAKTSKLLEKLKKINISDKEITHEILMMRTNLNQADGHVVKKTSFKWFETKYVGGGQRDIEFLNFFYKDKLDLVEEFEVSKKIILFRKVESLYFKIDQVVNICFLDNKQDNLPSQAVNLLIKETVTRDLGSLKAYVKKSKLEIFKILSSIVDSYNDTSIDYS